MCSIRNSFANYPYSPTRIFHAKAVVSSVNHRQQERRGAHDMMYSVKELGTTRPKSKLDFRLFDRRTFTRFTTLLPSINNSQINKQMKTYLQHNRFAVFGHGRLDKLSHESVIFRPSQLPSMPKSRAAGIYTRNTIQVMVLAKTASKG